MNAGLAKGRLYRLTHMSRLTRRNLFYGILFASPWLLGMLFFVAYPLFASMYYSFTDYSGLNPQVNWIGLQNYEELILHDQGYHRALYNSLYYAVGAVPLGILTGVSLALMLNMKIRGQTIYRTIYFLPVLIPDVYGKVVLCLGAWEIRK